MIAFFRRILGIPPKLTSVTVPALTNQAFAPFESDFYSLFEACYYQRMICRQRVIEAVRTDNRANIWLLISCVGAGGAGTLKTVLHWDTDPMWEIASLISVALGVLALYRRAPDIKYEVFKSLVAFTTLSREVQQKDRQFRVSGTDQDILLAFTSACKLLDDEIANLGPEHIEYADKNQVRLSKKHKKGLRWGGLAHF